MRLSLISTNYCGTAYPQGEVASDKDEPKHDPAQPLFKYRVQYSYEIPRMNNELTGEACGFRLTGRHTGRLSQRHARSMRILQLQGTSGHDPLCAARILVVPHD
jgi:hypothetical protein